MSKNELEKAVDASDNELPVVLDANTLYREFIGLTNIERVKKEDFVLKSLMTGVPKKRILETLKAEHPDYSFSSNDLEKFLARNYDVVRSMKKDVTLSARRHLEAREQCSEVLAGLALYTQMLVRDFRSEGDNTNTVAAIRALNTTLENYMKLEGFVGTQNEGGKVVNIINSVTENKNNLKDRVHRANFVDVEPTE